MMTQSHVWGSKPDMSACLLGIPNSESRREGYEVKSANRVIVLGVARARRARWSKQSYYRRFSASTREGLPSENIAAIKLLDSWLSTPEVKDNDLGEGIRRRIDENRLSDRKFFT